MKQTSNRLAYYLAIPIVLLTVSAAIFIYKKTVERELQTIVLDMLKEVEQEVLSDLENINLCTDKLVSIADAINAYQMTHDGHNPTLLVDVCSDEQLTCPANDTLDESYVYRGFDLDSDAKPEMILAYDNSPDHADMRNVLFAGEVLLYFVDDAMVSRTEYERTREEILSIHNPEDRMLVDDAILLKTFQDGSWMTKAYSEPTRIKTLTEEEFQQAINRDNQLRTEKGLSQLKV